MGLSLLNLGKRIWDQVNPLDNGRTFANPQGNAPQQQAAGHAPPSALHQLTHNGVTNVMGDLTAKPFVINPLQNAVEAGRLGVAAVTHNNPAFNASRHREFQNLQNSIPGWFYNQGYHIGQLGANLPGAIGADISGFQGHAPTPYEQASLQGARQAFNQTFLGQMTSPVQGAIDSFVPGAKQDSAQAGYDVNGSWAKKNLAEPILGTVSAAGLAGTAAAGLPKLGDTAATMAGKVAAMQDRSGAIGVGETAPQPAPVAAPVPVTSGPKPTVKLVDTTSPKPVENVPPVPKTPNTGVKAVTQAIQNLSNHYHTAKVNGTNALDVAEQAKANARTGAQLSALVWKALNKSFTPEEQAATYDALQGVKNADLTPRAAKVAKALKPLYKTALEVRQGIDGTVRQVQEYVPRVEKRSVGAQAKEAVSNGKGVLGKINSIFDLGHLDSPFNHARTVGKFVGSDGSVQFGTPKELGIVQHEDGTLSNGRSGAKRVTYSRAKTNTNEISAATGREYHKGIGRLTSLYHADTTSLQARYAALKELANNPNKHGLFTKAQVQSGVAPDGMVELQVPQLHDANGDNFYADAKTAKGLERDPMFGKPDRRSLPAKAYDAVSNLATQAIVLNPIFHGANQTIQSLIAAGNISGKGGGWVRLAEGMRNMTDEDVTDYLSQKRAHIPTYGKEVDNVMSKLTNGASKLNNKAMAAIELRLRVGLYKASVEGGMDKQAAIDNINKFLGNDKQVGRNWQRITLFAHYFKTMLGALKEQAVHPIDNAGANVNTVAVTALLLGTSKAYQQFTGNQNAYARLPGEIGMGKELFEAGKSIVDGKLVRDAQSGKLPTLVNNRVNPVLKELVQQSSNHDLFTGKPVTDTASSSGLPAGRTSHLVNSLVAPAQQVGYGTAGKRSIPELVENQTGLYTPHAKGDVATTNKALRFLNTKGAKKAQGNDVTGYSQQNAYFDSNDRARASLPAASQPWYDTLTASTAKLTDKQMQAHYADLFAHPEVVAAITKQKQEYAKRTGTPLDPLYSNDITPAQRQEYMHLQALSYKGDDYTQQANANASWLKPLYAARSDYFNHVDFTNVSKNDRVQPPVFDNKTQADLNTAGSLSGTEKAQFIANHPNVQQAYQSIFTYTNNRRVADGDTPFKPFPTPDKQTQALITFYNNLPQHDGPKGGNASRAAWIKANQGAFGKIQQYYSQVAEYELANSAGQDKYQGATPSQTELKAAYDMGKYDVAVSKDANGKSVYSVNPGLAYATSAVGGGRSGSYSSSRSYRSSSSYKDAKYLANSAKHRIHAPKGRVRSPKVKLYAGTAGPKTGAKIAMIKPTKASVHLKKSKV